MDARDIHDVSRNRSVAAQRGRERVEGARRVFVMAWLRADVRDSVPRRVQGGQAASQRGRGDQVSDGLGMAMRNGRKLREAGRRWLWLERALCR